MILTITKGAHWRNTHLPALTEEPRQFAHIFDPAEPEDYVHQAQNFMTYATALGSFEGPHIVIGPHDDPFVEIQMAEYALLVESCTGVQVKTR